MRRNLFNNGVDKEELTDKNSFYGWNITEYVKQSLSNASFRGTPIGTVIMYNKGTHRCEAFVLLEEQMHYFRDNFGYDEPKIRYKSDYYFPLGIVLYTPFQTKDSNILYANGPSLICIPFHVIDVSLTTIQPRNSLKWMNATLNLYRSTYFSDYLSAKRNDSTIYLKPSYLDYSQLPSTDLAFSFINGQSFHNNMCSMNLIDLGEQDPYDYQNIILKFNNYATYPIYSPVLSNDSGEYMYPHFAMEYDYFTIGEYPCGKEFYNLDVSLMRSTLGSRMLRPYNAKGVDTSIIKNIRMISINEIRLLYARLLLLSSIENKLTKPYNIYPLNKCLSELNGSVNYTFMFSTDLIYQENTYGLSICSNGRLMKTPFDTSLNSYTYPFTTHMIEFDINSFE